MGESTGSIERQRRRARRWAAAHWRAALEWGAMAAIVALAATLNLWDLRATGYGNYYYAAAVRSMASNWHAFFYAAYDPAGFISVDKPPLGFWAQVASVKLLGYSAMSLLLPEALAGALSVVVIWRVTRVTFGALAGVVAALALAISPVNVVTNRDNILEPLLTLTLLLGAWAALAAARRGSLRWLLVCAVLVGLGFNIKMLEAYIVVPALALVYLFGAPRSLRLRVGHLALAGVVMLALSFAWVAAVDLTPAAQRPYVGSTTTNSELELALGYNGIGRLFSGPFWQPLLAPFERLAGGASRGAPTVHWLADHQPIPDAPTIPGVHSIRPPVAPRPDVASHIHRPAPPRSPAARDPNGTPGPLRLLQPGLGSEVSWLLPLALLGLLTLPLRRGLAARRAVCWRGPSEPASQLGAQGQGYLLWGMWLLAGGACFSLARSINAYYVATLAPAVCALAAVGAVRLWRAWRDGGWRATLPPLALALTAVEQERLLDAAPDAWRPWLGPTLLLAAALLAAALLTLWAARRLLPRLASGSAPRQWGAGLAVVALATLLLAPMLWSLASLTNGNEGGWPKAGPDYAYTPTLAQAKEPLADPTTVRYLEAHRGGARFAVATLDAYTASPLIITADLPVMNMGGFAGYDHILTPTTLARVVESGQAQYFLLPSSNVTPAQRVALFSPAASPSGGVAQASDDGQGQALAETQSEAAPQAHGGRALASGQVKGMRYTNALTQWVSQRCAPIPPAQWSSATYARHHLGAWELFVCDS